MHDEADHVRHGRTLRDGMGLLATGRWPRVVGFAAMVALAVTVLAAFLSRGRSDAHVLGDLGGLWLGIVATIVLAAGIDERLSTTWRTMARWLSLMACVYVFAALSVVVVAAFA